MSFTPLKGTQDVYGEKWYLRQWVASQILNVLTRYGFRQVQTPVLESRELMSILAGKDMTDQMYTLTDKSGRDLVIRSDITPALTRLFIQTGKSQPKPLKFSCFDRIYRYERPQEGRYREIYQINAELYGAKPPIADAELLAAFYACFAAIGLRDTTVVIGYRPLLARFLLMSGTSEDQVSEVIRVIDKRTKISSSEFEVLLISAGFPAKKRPELEAFLSCRGSITETRDTITLLATTYPPLRDYTTKLTDILSLLPAFGIADQCVVDLGLARGFQYYTGIIFEAIYPKSTLSIGGGGRYDTLVQAFGGPPTAATGFSLGFDRITSLVTQTQKGRTFSPQVDYVVVSDATGVLRTRAIHLAQQLRSNGYIVDLDLVNRTISEQLSRAKKLIARYAVVIKPDNIVSCINLKTTKEQSMKENNFIKSLLSNDRELDTMKEDI